MRYIDITESGGADNLVLAECEAPVAGAGEVLIRVAAAGVNRADIIQRQGFYPPPPGASAILGLEVAGEITALGVGVERWQIGDKVCALLSGGGYAEYVTANAAECLPVPAGYSMAQAAALPETLLTVWSNVMQRAALQPGETFLVHGGSSGIGTTAIQLVKQLGCRVFATAGSDAKVAVCEQLGAEVAVNYRQQDFVEVLLEATGGAGVDVILDMVGGSYFERNIALAAADGRIVNIAYLQGSKVEVNLMPVMLKRLHITGSTLRARPALFKAELTAAVEAAVWPWLAQGSVAPVLHQTFAAENAASAHKLMEASDHIGKLVLSWET